MQQNKDVIIGDGRDSEDVTTKDQDDFSDKTYLMLRSNVCIGPNSAENAAMCVPEWLSASGQAGGEDGGMMVGDQ